MFSNSGQSHYSVMSGYFPPWLIIGEIMVITTCMIGDKILEQGSFNFTGAAWAKAFTDSLTHGLVAFFSWLIVRAELKSPAVIEMVVCLLMAMFVDSDHFLAARSFNIHDATALNHRPPFHNSSLILVITLLLLMLSRTWPGQHSLIIEHLPLIFAVAWTSHHLRDATRRGLWFWPLGSTRPLPRYVYIGSTMLLPVLTRILLVAIPGTVQLKLKSSGSGILNV